MDNAEPKIRAMSKTELANAYQVSLTTLNNWLKPFLSKIGEYRGKCYTPKQIKTIFDLIGFP